MPISEWGMVRSDGSPIPLNLYSQWTSTYDILNLPTGYYSGYVQTTNKDPDYGIAVNLPESVNGFTVELTVIDFGYEGRKSFKLVRISDGSMYSTTCTGNRLESWGYHLISDDDSPVQQKRLTYANGEAMSWQNGTSNPIQGGKGELVVPITSLETGFYRGSIQPMENDNRDLPTAFPTGQVATALIWDTQDDRRTILLFALFSNIGWFGTTGDDGSGIKWKRMDEKEDLLGSDKAMFSIEMNKQTSKHFKMLTITDTHWQQQAPTTQIGYINPSHFDNIEDLDRQIKTNDITVHLGDWIDGNYEKKLSSYSLANLGAKFFEKPNRYGVIGNHDYNGQWDGNAGMNHHRAGDLDYILTTDEVKHYMTPEGKPFYHVDHPDKKIRMVYLQAFDVPFWVNPATKQMFVNPLDQKGFGAVQVEWFIATLKSVPIGYDVIIVTHDTFNKVFENSIFYNGDMMRIIAEAYQNKTVANKMTTDIGMSNPVYPYYKLAVCSNGCIDFSNSKGSILGVLSGHRHEDNTQFMNGIRYISLLCSRPAGDGTPNKPLRDYYNITSEAITFLEFDREDETIISNRFGAGESYNKFNMFSY